MSSEKEFIENHLSHKEEKLIVKTEPTDIDFIKKEEIEEEYFVVPGIVDSLEINKASVKEEVFQNEQIDNSSSSNVWKDLFLFCYIQFSI